jgi:hypothetical protein
MTDSPQIQIPSLCDLHARLLVQQTGFEPNDHWRVLILATQVALFQAATCDQKTYERLDGVVTRIATLGCLACYKPDAFGEIIDAAQKVLKEDALGAIKALGEKWVVANAKPAEDGGNRNGQG